MVEVTYKDIYNLETLTTAWEQIRRRGGPDSLVIDVVENTDYDMNLQRNLGLLSRKLQLRTYSPTPARALATTKSGGLTRAFVTLDLEDSIVSQAIAFNLAIHMDAKLSDGVFSMRATKNRNKPFRGWYDDWPKYQKRLQRLLSDDSFVVISDITGYFDNIDLRLLKEQLLRLNTIDPLVIDLVLFLLESWMYRQLYGISIGRGIPQADLDFPRSLSNFFLYPHDDKMQEICPDRYVRWIDDMNFIVGSEVEGKKVITELEMSLKRLFLTPNSSKTRVLSPHKIRTHFLFSENDFLSDFEKRLKKRQKSGEGTEGLEDELKKRFDAFSTGEQVGNWEKVLKRYYTYFKRLGSDFLLGRIPSDLVERPTIDDKIHDYLLAMDFRPEILRVITNYLTSPNNLYPSTEVRLLTLLLHLRIPIGISVESITSLAKGLLFGGSAKHWYSRCLAALLLAKYSQMSDVHRMAVFLADSGDNLENGDVKKHLLAVAFLLQPGDSDLKAAIDYGRGQHDLELSRLVHFWDAINSGTSVPETVKRRLSVKVMEAPKRKHLSMRTFLALRMLCWNSALHGQLKGVVGNLSKENEDPFMQQKLDALLREIS